MSGWKRNLCLSESICEPIYLKPQFEKLTFTPSKDASEKAHECTVYARFISVDHQFVRWLVVANTRVAPHKSLTIPRLELMAATLAIRLTDKVRSAWPPHCGYINFCADSTIILYYIRNNLSSFATCMANKISEIREYSNLEHWNHPIGAMDLANLYLRQTVLSDTSLS